MRHCALEPGLPAGTHQDVLVRLPVPGNTDMTAAVRRYVTPATGRLPRFLQLLHGNFVTLDERGRRRFLSRLARSARQVSDRELAALLENGWRSRLTASWLIGLDKREQFRDRIGELLLDSEAAYAGQGYCIALARFATPADASLLAAYLATYLPQADKRYDQDWALRALLHIDAALGTDHAAPFLTDGGLWQQWRTTEDGAPRSSAAWIEQLCTVADECMHKT
jgi:Family of unknown function (DUF6000)